MQTGQKYTGRFANPVGDHRALLQLEIERSADELLRDLEQLLGKRHQLICRESAMPLVHDLGERIGNASANPDYRRFLDTELHGDGVGRLEPDAPDVTGQPVSVLGHDLNGVGAIGLENPHCSRRAYAVAVQENHYFPHRLLLGPGGKNACGPNRPDPIDLTQTVGRGLDNVEDLVAKGAHELLCVNRANAPDHAGREVLLDAVGGGRG
jgi:hypothetical protein